MQAAEGLLKKFTTAARGYGSRIALGTGGFGTRTRTRRNLRPVWVPNIGVPHYIGVPHRVTGVPRVWNRHPVGPYSRTMPRLLWRS